MKYSDAIDALGSKAKDKITGRTGVISSVCFDLYGCIMVMLTPTNVGPNKEIKSFGWIDINRIKVSKSKKVMEHPNFETKYTSLATTQGPAEKPEI